VLYFLFTLDRICIGHTATLSVYKSVHMKQHTCHLTYYRFNMLTFHRFTKALFKLDLVSYIVTFSVIKILQNRSVAIKTILISIQKVVYSLNNFVNYYVVFSPCLHIKKNQFYKTEIEDLIFDMGIAGFEYHMKEKAIEYF